MGIIYTVMIKMDIIKMVIIMMDMTKIILAQNLYKFTSTIV